MAFGIGSALKRGAKSAGRKARRVRDKFKDEPLNLVAPGVQDTIEEGSEAVQSALIPKVPEAPIPTVAAPIPDDAGDKRKRQRAAQRRYAGAGRRGTMLTSDNGTLG